MNNVNAETARQFNAIAPRALKINGRKYSRKSALYSNETNTVNFHFNARRKSSEIVASKVSVNVTYQRGSDTYRVEVVHADGETFENTTIKTFDQMYGETFADLALFI